MRLPLALLLSLVLAAASGCAWLPMRSDTQARQEKLEQDIATFYKNVADAYFLAGWEFYELAKEMEKAGKTEEASKYYHKAYILSRFSSELRKNAGQSSGKNGMSLPRLPSEME